MSETFARDGSPGWFECVDAVVGAWSDGGSTCLSSEGDGYLFKSEDLKLAFGLFVRGKCDVCELEIGKSECIEIPENLRRQLQILMMNHLEFGIDHVDSLIWARLLYWRIPSWSFYQILEHRLRGV